jgi:diguanylate cyclase
MNVWSAAESPLFVLGVVFGASIICVGVLVGVLVDRRGRKRVGFEPQHALSFLRGLFEWTSGLANEVAEFREVVDGVTRKINDDESPPITDTATPRWLTQLVQANQKLQERLDDAEETLKKQSAELATYMSAASTDALTGLPNRRVFDQELRRRYAEWRRHGLPFAVLLVDVDHFKKFNDQYGHLVGDKVLQEVSRILQATMRETDLVTRFGGEEFAIVLPASGQGEASRAAERVRVAVEKSLPRHDNEALKVTVSCGVANATTDDTSESLLKRADEALYASKRTGRNRAHWHDGRRSVSVTHTPPAGSNAAPADRTPNPDPVAPHTASPEFGSICHDVRRRLLDVARREEGQA